MTTLRFSSLSRLNLALKTRCIPSHYPASLHKNVQSHCRKHNSQRWVQVRLTLHEDKILTGMGGRTFTGRSLILTAKYTQRFSWGIPGESARRGRPPLLWRYFSDASGWLRQGILSYKLRFLRVRSAPADGWVAPAERVWPMKTVGTGKKVAQLVPVWLDRTSQWVTSLSHDAFPSCKMAECKYCLTVLFSA